MGNRTRCSYLLKANPSGPRDCSRAMARQPLGKRRRNWATHSWMASGVCSSSFCSTLLEPSTCRAQACFLSPQSIPMKAANVGWEEAVVSDIFILYGLWSSCLRTGPCSSESLIVESGCFGQTTSENSFGNKAQPAARHSGQDVSCLLGVEVVAAGCPLRSHVSANDA